MAQVSRFINPAAIPDGHYVQLDGDLLFELHGLAPRYGLIHAVDGISYIYLAETETAFDQLDPNTLILDLGDFEMLADDPLTMPIINNYIKYYKGPPDSQIIALALIRSKIDQVDVNDELGLYRLTQWAKTYQGRACWIAKNKQLAYSKANINWKALQL